MSKCLEIEYKDDYNAIINDIGNPYGYNFGVLTEYKNNCKKIKNQYNKNYYK